MQASSTQQFLDIAGIQEGVVVLKNGGYRIIFSVSAVNFSLKSEEEQNSIIFQYQSFLNSLHFPIQIVMRSKKLDLNPYIKKVNEAKEKQKSELIKMQTEDYVDFISQLINLANIMKKTFYVVVTYDPVSVQSPSILGKLFKKSEDPSSLRISSATFKRYKEELTQRASSVASGLGSMGLHCVQLTTEEIIELFYNIYNPGVADKERFSNVEELTGEFVADVHEKPKGTTEPSSAEATEGKEEVIDNSQIVEEQHKKEGQMKQMASDNEGERQIAGNAPKETPAAVAPAGQVQEQVTPAAEPATPSTTPTATPPAVPVAQNNIGSDVQKPAPPVSQNQPPVAPPPAPAQ